MVVRRVVEDGWESFQLRTRNDGAVLFVCQLLFPLPDCLASEIMAVLDVCPQKEWWTLVETVPQIQAGRLKIEVMRRDKGTSPAAAGNHTGSAHNIKIDLKQIHPTHVM